MSRPTRESIMNALFNALTVSVNVPFTANVSLGSTTLGSPNTNVGLFVGLPVFGVGIPRGAVITAFSPSSVTISLPATANGSNVPLTTGFLTFSRRFQAATSVAAQPALFLRDGDEDVVWKPLGSSGIHDISLEQLTLNAQLWIYSQAGANPDVPPAMILNNMLDAVLSAFKPDAPSNQFTLGGLVSWCRIVGKIMKAPGDLDQQSIASADIQILVP